MQIENVYLQAAYGGGGRGMRIVREMSEAESQFEIASSEALRAFGNGAMFIEKYLERPRHIEIQLLGNLLDLIIRCSRLIFMISRKLSSDVSSPEAHA